MISWGFSFGVCVCVCVGGGGVIFKGHWGALLNQQLKNGRFFRAFLIKISYIGTTLEATLEKL